MKLYHIQNIFCEKKNFFYNFKNHNILDLKILFTVIYLIFKVHENYIF